MRDAEIEVWSRWALIARILPMRDAEIEVWSRWASPPVVAQARSDGRRAYDGYLMRGCAESEALAAGQATLELAIICHVWPQPLDPVLRPSLRWMS